MFGRSGLVLIVAAVALASGVAADIFDPHRRFTITQRLRDPNVGQSFFNFSDSVHSMGRYIAVGTTSANAAKGLCRVYYDDGNGYSLMVTLTDPAGTIGDDYGRNVHLFTRDKAPHVAVAAPFKKGDGAVLVYRRQTDTYWPLQQELTPPTNTGAYSTNFGRHVVYDGTSVVVSAESRYKNSKRFIISSTNIKGTRFFEESSGVGPVDGDPVFVYQARDGRRNSTRLLLQQTIRGADYTFDFGASMALSTDRNTLAVGAFSRREARFGFGTDGDLKVTDVKLLDGSAEYNFNNIEIHEGGVLTTDLYDTLRAAGGILRIRVQGTLKIHKGGVINMTAHGFKGAPTATENSRRLDGYGPGGGITATSQFTGPQSCNHDNAGIAVLTGSGAESKTVRNSSSDIAFAEANGGGGGYGTAGQAGTTVQCGVSGTGGSAYGDPDLVALERGSGGGAGHPWKIGSGGAGGDGGGVVWIMARRVINEGVIVCDGGRGSDGGFYSGGGGGGSGGSIFISGTFLENYGHIYARGGKGGIRSTSSGTSGLPSVKGGDGGVGRIRLEFLTTVSSGIVVPAPKNGTAFDGDIYLYRRSLTTGLYTNYAKLPRLPAMRFIGHAVAIHGHMLAVASDDRSFANPVQSVFLVDFSVVQNSSSPIYRAREIHRPNAEDLQFGWRLALFNDTLVIGAAGQNDLVRGALYIMSGRHLFERTTELHTLHHTTPSAGDYYASVWHYAYPLVLVQVPVGQDDGFSVSNGRLSAGNIQVWRHIRNISTEHSTITCEYASATANTSVLCSIHTRDLHGEPAGEVHDLAAFSYPPNLRYINRGLYQFDVVAKGSGPMEVWARHSGSKLPSASITVTPPIMPYLANLTCTPLHPVAGDTVTCTVKTFNTAGEESAAKDFRVTVYHANDVTLRPVHQDKKTPLGNYRTPPSGYVPTEVLETDFPTEAPAMKFVRFGTFEFSYKTWRPGPHAAFVQYQNHPLAFPNPVIIDATEPTISPTKSTILCPAISAPNRTIVCTLYLRSATGVPTDRAELAKNFSGVSGRYLRAKVIPRRTHAASNQSLEISALWAQEGRISLLMYPEEEGQLRIDGEYDGTTIPMNPADGVRISTRFDTTCVRMSSVAMSFTVMNQHAMGRADSTVYGNVATDARYVESLGMCDNGRV